MDLAAMNEFGNRYAEAWGSHAAESVAAFYSEDGSLRVNDDLPAVGRKAIAEVARAFMTAFPDMKVTMDELAAGPPGAVFHWTLTGTNTGPGGTGRRVRIRGYEVWQMGADGLIGRSEGHFDSAEYERQLRDGVDS
jgi:steroid delta-isomerase-like uncharacterized protein